MTTERRAKLLEGDGLEASGVSAATRQRVVDHVMQDFARARRAQGRAILAWVLHATLFSVVWVLNIGAHGGAFARFIGLRTGAQPYGLDGAPLGIYDYSFTDGGLTRALRQTSGGEILLSALYWLNGFAFVAAIFLTAVWLIRMRSAESGIGMIDLLSGRELRNR